MYVKNVLVLRKYTLMYLRLKEYDVCNSPPHSSRRKKCGHMRVGRKKDRMNDKVSKWNKPVTTSESA